MKHLIIILCFLSLGVFAQEKKDAPKSEAPKVLNEKIARKYVREGNMLYNQQKFSDAEVAYKKAIENNPAYEMAKYNLGNAFSQQNRNKEAIAQYELLAKETKDKKIRSKLMHNIGNNYYKEKDYQKSVEAYKNSLRVNPKDDETRYNLALAQMMLDDKQNKDKDKDKDKKDDQEKDKDKQDQDKKEGDDEQDDKNNEDQNKDPKNPEDDKKDQKKKPQPGKLSPQQMQQLLDAMANEEKKTQEKMNAKKEKGKKTKQEKDW